jgi:hypothetical protein
MGDENPERDQAELPSIPIFFSSEDLPAWLRPDADTSEAAAPPERETRARVAWATNPSANTPTETPFGAAADATWHLLTPPPRHAKRGRRATGAH